MTNGTNLFKKAIIGMEEINLTNKQNNKIIKLDYDKYIPINKFLFRYKRLYYLLPFHINNLAIYKTKRGYHLELYIDKSLADFEIVFFQLLFLSDYIRETINLHRVKCKEKGWNVLFDEKLDKTTNKFHKRKYLANNSKYILKQILNINKTKMEELKCKQKKK